MIKNEQEALEFWNKQFKENGNVGWGSVPQFEWFQKKQDALESIANKDLKILEIGCGDFSVLKDVFLRNPMRYTGIDGSIEMIEHNKKLIQGSTDIEFIHKQFSDLVKEKVSDFSVIIAFDVLFHIVDDKLYTDLVKWIFAQKAKYVLLTYHEIDKKDQSYERGHFIPRPFKVKQKGYKVIFETSFKDREDLKLVIYEKTS